MNFKQATDDLFEAVDHDRLAKSLGVSIASIRQARLKPNAKAHRTAPAAWKQSVIQLAEERVHHYQRLIEHLRFSSEAVASEKAIALLQKGDTSG